ncbi:MAG: oxygen-independent coproporphyrinogen III oxidase [Selenomonadales bacterium]|nr:oxygen-independent coproporphyrinogen III oxidase [Selenomonadales bacterium]
MKLGIYIHIPFCKQKCYYCDFPWYAGKEACQDYYLDALLFEIRKEGRAYQDRIVDTVFFGGGTPSVLPKEALPRIIAALRESFTLADDAEVSAEANPGTVDKEKLTAWREAGIDRISFGVQSFHDSLLRNIGRIHTAEQATDAIKLAREAGFDNINLDLIYGLPSQTVAMLEDDVKRAVSLGIEHISVYGLIVEEDTVLEAMVDEGKVTLPSDEDEEAMYDHVTTHLEDIGYLRYEISNYARDGKVCRHNLKYWQFADYLGLGSAAHSFVAGKRFANERSIDDYIRRMTEEGTARLDDEAETIEELRGEYVFLALRTTEGIDTEDFQKSFGMDFFVQYGDIINRMMTQGLLMRDGRYVRLTKLGMKYGNRVFAQFV